ncbi:hypothetical protein H4218_005584 [Coemansia sp. IMI 209128]|nr:hypothetical protein H4218_005584 [Coemansia sp. IMI 209128]
MHLSSPLQALPLDVIEYIVGHVAGSSRLQFDGVTNGTKEQANLLRPLLSVSHCFRAVAISHFCQTHTLFLDSVSACVWDVRAAWFHCFRHEKLPMHPHAKTLHIEVGENHIYNGLALGALLRKPYADYTFPKARLLRFKFDSSRGLRQPADGETTLPEIEANITAFAGRIKHMAPMVQKVCLEPTRNHSTHSRIPSQHFDSLVAQICQSVGNVELLYLSRLVRVEPFLSGLCQLEFRDGAGGNAELAVQLAQHNAVTLQRLELHMQGNDDVHGLIKDAEGGYVEYSCLHMLKLVDKSIVDLSRRPVFPNAQPFPFLRSLSLAPASPFGDDTPFRGNSATLERLNLYLSTAMVQMLKKNEVFGCIKHPKLQFVKLEWNFVHAESRFIEDLTFIRFGLTIGSNVVAREVSCDLPAHGLDYMLSPFENHKCIEVIELPQTGLSILEVISLVKALPLFRHLHSKVRPGYVLPSDISRHKLPAYMIETYSPIGQRFRCWRINADPDLSFEITVQWALLLALVCPNLDYVAVSSNARELFMAYMKEMIATNGFRQHATRLRRLLFGGWSNTIPNVNVAKAKNRAALAAAVGR